MDDRYNSYDIDSASNYDSATDNAYDGQSNSRGMFDQEEDNYLFIELQTMRTFIQQCVLSNYFFFFFCFFCFLLLTLLLFSFVCLLAIITWSSQEQCDKWYVRTSN